MRLPRHATVVAYLALFIALGGTAYAATGGNFLLGHANQTNKTSSLKNTGSGPALKLTTKKKTTPPLGVSNDTKITHLNADELDGLSSNAFQRKTASISASTTSPNTAAAGKIGPWSLSMNCDPTFARLTITGPGDAGGTTTVANGNSAGSTSVVALGAIGSGFATTANNGQQASGTIFLQSGSTNAEVQFLLTASNGGLFENCAVIGTGALVGS